MITLVTEALTEINVNFEETRYGRIRVNSLDAVNLKLFKFFLIAIQVVLKEEFWISINTS